MDDLITITKTQHTIFIVGSLLLWFFSAVTSFLVVKYRKSLDSLMDTANNYKDLTDQVIAHNRELINHGKNGEYGKLRAEIQFEYVLNLLNTYKREDDDKTVNQIRIMATDYAERKVQEAKAKEPQ